MNRHFSKADSQMAHKHRNKGCLKSLVVRELQIKTTAKHHFTHIWMNSIKKSESNKFWLQCGKIKTLIDFWRACNMPQPL